MARRKEVFALSRLAWTANGYTMSLRLGVVEIVRTAVDDGVFEDSSRLEAILDGVRRDFLSFSPLPDAPHSQRRFFEALERIRDVRAMNQIIHLERAKQSVRARTHSHERWAVARARNLPVVSVTLSMFSNHPSPRDLLTSKKRKRCADGFLAPGHVTWHPPCGIDSQKEYGWTLRERTAIIRSAPS